jgi:hypothetical protein
MKNVGKQLHQAVFYVLFLLCAGLIVAALLIGSSSHGCLFPLAFIFLLVAIAQGARLRTSSRELPAEIVEQQLEWMYGKNWYKRANEEEILLAEKRIRDRRILRWQFAILALPLFGIAILFSIALALTFIKYNEPDHGLFLMIFAGIGFPFLLITLRAFPINRTLQVREREFARNIDELSEMPEFFDKNKL